MSDKEKGKNKVPLGIVPLFTAVLVLAKLLESPYLEDVPWWSWNVFTFSIGILYVWAFWFLTVVLMALVLTAFVEGFVRVWKKRK